MSRSGRLILGAVIAAGAVLGATQITSGSTNSTKETVFVGIVPTRLLDTRENAITFDGFDQAVGRLDADTTYELDIASRAGIPIDAASVTANFVAVDPSGPGHLTVYPCSVDRPNASALNYMPGVNNANEFSVPLGPDGDICIYTHAETDIVVDIYGYYIDGSGGIGEQGPKGDPGEDAESPARVIWVADDGTGDFTLLSTALASIDATSTEPYVIKIAPGVYEEDERVVLKDDVDVEGSGQGITTIECACSSNSNGALNAAVVSATDVTAEIRHLTINNTGGGKAFSIGLFTDDVDDEFSMLHVTATAEGGSNNYGIYNAESSPTMNNVTATALGGTDSYGVYNNDESSPTMNNVTATATDAGTENNGVYNVSSEPSMNNVTATANGGSISRGVYNSDSSPTMNNVTARARAGSASNYGVYNISASTAEIRNSSITGTQNSIFNSTSSAQVADTMLDGTVVAGNGIACVGAHTEAFVALNAQCN